MLASLIVEILKPEHGFIVQPGHLITRRFSIAGNDVVLHVGKVYVMMRMVRVFADDESLTFGQEELSSFDCRAFADHTATVLPLVRIVASPATTVFLTSALSTPEPSYNNRLKSVENSTPLVMMSSNNRLVTSIL